jgi:hypothetical protein
MAGLQDIYGSLRQAVLDRYAVGRGGDPGSAFVGFELGTPVPEETFRLADAERTLSPELAVEFLANQANSVPDVKECMLTRSERTVEGQYGLLLAGATTASPAALEMFGRVKQAALAEYDIEVPSLRGQGGFRPVLATPINWYDSSIGGNWTHVSIGMSDDPPPATRPHVNPIMLKWRVAPEALKAVIHQPVSTETFLRLRSEPIEASIPATRRAGIEAVRDRNIFLRRTAVAHIVAAPAVEARSRPGIGRWLVGERWRAGAGIEITRVAGHEAGAATGTAEPAVETHSRFSPLLDARAAADFQLVVGAATEEQPVAADSFHLEVDMCLVDIKRSWISDALMSLPDWYVPGFPRGAFSSGTADRSGLLPILPTACIFIRNVTIKSQWSQEDLQVIESSASLGSFSMFGRSFDRNTMTLTLPGMQMFAWVCEPLPALPPRDPPNA